MKDNANRVKKANRRRRSPPAQYLAPQIAAEEAGVTEESPPLQREEAEAASKAAGSWQDRLPYVYLCVLIPCLIYTVFYTVRAIWFDYTPVPITDNWRFVAFLDEILKLSPRHLWLQHNDHRIIFPEIVYALDFILFHGRLVLPAAFNIACQVLQIGLMWWLLTQSELPRAFQLALGVACTLFMASALHVGAILGSTLVVWYLSQTAAVVCFFFLWRSASTGRLLSLIISIAAAVVGTYSVGNGMVIWPVMIFMAGISRLPKRRIAGILIAGILSVSAYFVDYRFLEQGRMSLLLHHPFYAFWFALVYLGSPLSYVNVWLGGMIGLTGFLLVALASALAVRQHRTGDVAFAVAAAVCLYIAGSAMMGAYGRMAPSDMAFGFARAGRYISVQLTYWANLSVVIGWLAMRAPWRRSLALHVAAVGLTAVLLSAVMDQQNVQESAFAASQASAHEAGIALLVGIEDPAVMRAIYPDPGFPLRYVAGIRQKRLSIFSSGRHDWIGQPLDRLFAAGPPGRCSGYLERLQPVAGGYRATGWAMDRETGGAATDIVLIDPSGIVIGLGETRPGGYPPLIDDIGPGRLDWDWVGFARGFRAPETVRAYAVVGSGKISCALGASRPDGSSTPNPRNDVYEGPAATFANEVLLSGYSIRDKGGHTEVELRWSALRRPSGDYVAFVHVLDATGHLAFQVDHPLRNAARAPTSGWAVGATAEDRFFVTPPPNRPLGMYALKIGLYLASPFKIVPLTAATLPRGPTEDWKNLSVVIGNVECR
jgi:hypothetical protein